MLHFKRMYPINSTSTAKFYEVSLAIKPGPANERTLLEGLDPRSSTSGTQVKIIYPDGTSQRWLRSPPDPTSQSIWLSVGGNIDWGPFYKDSEVPLHLLERNDEAATQVEPRSVMALLIAMGTLDCSKVRITPIELGGPNIKALLERQKLPPRFSAQVLEGTNDIDISADERKALLEEGAVST